ncbi:MAG: hypothetical protein J6S41_00485, partial [Clostridia bacterium]|nr:hypothetical protein [Clostridia bacterium]
AVALAVATAATLAAMIVTATAAATAAAIAIVIATVIVTQNLDVRETTVRSRAQQRVEMTFRLLKMRTIKFTPIPLILVPAPIC